MSKWAENQCDRLVQEIACTAKSQWSNYPAECGHHIIGRGNLLWRWRLMNIAPLTIEEHGMTHAGLLDPLFGWQKQHAFEHRNDTLTRFLVGAGQTRDEFVKETLEYLRDVKKRIDAGELTFNDIIQKERERYGTL